uniref:Uncharacterized protein n=1 Tax=Mesocestoides corti TaxID=53468 RepID=A0A5K3G587_MESCO
MNSINPSQLAHQTLQTQLDLLKDYVSWINSLYVKAKECAALYEYLQSRPNAFQHPSAAAPLTTIPTHILLGMMPCRSTPEAHVESKSDPGRSEPVPRDCRGDP